jgi:hypothetical protein
MGGIHAPDHYMSAYTIKPQGVHPFTRVLNSLTLYSFEWPSPHQKPLSKIQIMTELVTKLAG